MDCTLKIQHSKFSKYLATSKEAMKSYNKFHYKSYTDDNKKVRWCPEKGCDNCIEMKNYVGSDYILCKCGSSFCWKCGKQAHRPASCNDGEKWQLKNSAESENITWIMANTKNCPKCQKPIEKSQGCNHMTCRVCNHDFCWMCLGAWAEHGQKTGGYYNCNKYEELKKKGDTNLIKEENLRQNHQNQLRKYMFYFERFNNHERSEKHAKEILPAIRSKIELLH
jgi:ariadne-1